MSWRRVNGQNLAALVDFAAPREYRAAAFTSRIVRHSAIELPKKNEAAVWILEGGAPPDAVRAAILLTASGLCLPLFHEKNGPDPRELDQFFGLPTSNPEKIYCVLGRDEEVRLCTGSLGRPLSAERSFHLMTCGDICREGPERSVPGLVVRRIKEADADAFFPLERDYQLEEVVTAPGRYNEAAGQIHFRRQCRTQLVFGATIDGVPVAKAGTNAIGYRYCQIGGVYTLPALRGRGIAAAVMRRLLAAVASRGQRCTLFVRKENLPAVGLYLAFGFQIRCSYRISYPS